MEILLRLLEQFITTWLVPLVAAAILIPFFQILVFINPTLGGIVCFVAGGFFIWQAIRSAHSARIPFWNSWQLWCWVIIFLPGTIIAFVTPHYFHLWAFFWEVLVLSLILCLPGVVLAQARYWLVSLLIGELILTLGLFAGSLGKTNVPLLLLAFLALILGTIFFVNSARPYELRKAQRRIAKLMYIGAVLIIFASFSTLWWPILRGVAVFITGQDPQVFIEKILPLVKGR